MIFGVANDLGTDVVKAGGEVLGAKIRIPIHNCPGSAFRVSLLHDLVDEGNVVESFDCHVLFGCCLQKHKDDLQGVYF